MAERLIKSSPVDDTRNKRKFVSALARGLSVLRAFKPGDGVLSNREIAERTGLPKPTVTRLTYTLTELGYLNYYAELERYQLGPSVLALGYATLSNFGVRQTARPLMQALAEELDCAIALGARDRLTMMYIENQRGRGAVTLRLDVGSHIPLATTAMGRAFLAALPDGERDYLMEHIERRSGDCWLSVRDGIAAALHQYDRDGYVTVCGDWDRDVNAVGVPVAIPGSHDMYALNAGGPAFLMSEGRLDSEIGPQLKQLALNIQDIVNSM